MKRGRYIAFEGWEASGKSTQAERLAKKLNAVLTRDPGGTELGAAIREMLLGDGPVPSARSEALLFAADRAHHVDTIVEPALVLGRDVVTDRSFGSTLAYQGYGRGQSLDDLHTLIEWASGGLLPDIIILLQVPVEISNQRLGATRDRMEREDEGFAQRVISGFQLLAEQDVNRWKTVDASGSVEEIQLLVNKAIEED